MNQTFHWTSFIERKLLIYLCIERGNWKYKVKQPVDDSQSIYSWKNILHTSCQIKLEKIRLFDTYNWHQRRIIFVFYMKTSIANLFHYLWIFANEGAINSYNNLRQGSGRNLYTSGDWAILIKHNAKIWKLWLYKIIDNFCQGNC